MKKNRILIAFILVLVSLALHFYLMNSHYNFVYGGEGKSVCSINEKLNCESVSISPYAYLLGVPMASWGVAFHLVMILFFALYAFQDDKKTSALRWLRTMALISLASTLVMASISSFMMKTYCIFCISLYVLSIFIFIALWLKSEKPYLIRFDDMKWRNALIVFAAIPVLAFLLDDMSTRGLKDRTAAIVADALNNWENAPQETFVNPILTTGSADDKTKFSIVEFADFQCIHCRDSVDVFHSFVGSKPDVKMQFYSFPLDGSCNPGRPQHEAGAGKSCLLARAVYCSEKQNKGWQAHRWIFDRFGTEENSQFEKLISDLSLDTKSFRDCLTSEEAFHFIEENAKQANKAKVDSTPSVYVNGKRLDFGNQIFVLEALYKKLHSN